MQMIDTKMAQQSSYNLWSKYCGGGHYLLYPNENLTRFIFANRDKFNSVLDFGCGDGRHLEMMCRAGIKNLIGIDCSKAALDIAHSRCSGFDSLLELYHNPQKLNLSNFLGTKKVDCIVCWGVIFINIKSVVCEFLTQFNLALKTGGIFISNWRTRRDSLYEKGTKIDDDTFIINNQSKYNGMLYFFPNLDNIKQLYADSGFEIVSIDTEEFSVENLQTLHSWYIIKAKKV